MSVAPSHDRLRLYHAPRTVPYYEDEIGAGTNPRLVPGPWGVEVPLPFERQDHALRWHAARGRAQREAILAGKEAKRGAARKGGTLLPVERQRALSRGFLRALIEVAERRRPRQQLRGRIHDSALPTVDRLEKLSRALRSSGERLVLGAVTASQPHEWAVETAAVLLCGRRNRAMAGRLEREGGVWVCTDLSLIGGPA